MCPVHKHNLAYLLSRDWPASFSEPHEVPASDPQIKKTHRNTAEQHEPHVKVAEAAETDGPSSSESGNGSAESQTRDDEWADAEIIAGEERDAAVWCCLTGRENRE